MSSLTIWWNCYYDLFTENMSAEYNRKVKLKENYFITGLENKLRTIRRKYKMLGRTKIIDWTMCYQFTSYQFEGTLRAFIKTNLYFADQGKRRSQRLDSRSRPKINSGNWSLVVIQKFFLLKNELVRKVLSRQLGRTPPDVSLDMRHLIIMLTIMKYCKQCYCDSYCYVSDWILWIFMWYIYISLYVMCKIVM